ncbi:MAG: hypothetical protein AB4058_06455 [Microcystaceae cyanobacterium]
MDNKTRTAESFIRTIPAFGRKPPSFLLPFLPYDQIQPILYCAVVSLVISSLCGFNFLQGLCFCLWLIATWLALTGFRPWLFTNRFIKLPRHGYYNLATDFVSAEDPNFEKVLMQRQKPTSVKTQKGRTKTYPSIQKEIPFHALMEIEIDGVSACVLLLKNKKEWIANIPFAFQGIHHEPYDDEVLGTLDSVTDLLDNLLPGERITFYQGKHSRISGRLTELSQQKEKSAQLGLSMNATLYQTECQRTKELTGKGLRQEWEQKIFCTWRRSKAQARRSDFLSQIIDNCEAIWQEFSQILLGTAEKHLKLTYAELAQEIYQEGLTPWLMLLKNTGKLDVKPMSAESVWQWLWYRHQSGQAPPIPQYIKVFQNQQGQLTAEISKNYDRDALSVLFSQNNLPLVNKNRDSVVINEQCLGTMTLDGGMSQEGKPDSFGTLRNQLRYLYNILSRCDIRDTEFWVECELMDSSIIREDLEKTAQQSSASNKTAAERGKVVDVAANELQKEALAAQELIYQGRQGIKLGLTALVFRPSRPELDRACQTLAHAFGRAKLIRDTQVAWYRYLETSPLTPRKQLTSTHEKLLNFDPRLPFPSTEVPGLLPLSQPQSIFSKPSGVEFLAEGFPIHLHPLEHTLNFMITATKGSGKSVMLFAFIRHCLNTGPVLAMDMATGADSTFALIAQLYGEQASYIDLTQTAYNPLLIPDLRNLEAKEQSIRLDLWKSEIQYFLLSLVMGKVEDVTLEDRCRILLQKAFDFFTEDARIQKRYLNAIAGGLTSGAWKQQPTLRDFVPFCTRERLQLFDADELDLRTLSYIKRKLEAKINDPNIGRVLSSPSQVQPQAPFIFFSLSGLQDAENAQAMALVASQACSQIGMSYRRSLFIVDEVSTLVRVSPSFADLIGARFAVGRKFGQATALVGQDLEAILQCRRAPQILQNLDFSLIGKSTSAGASAFQAPLNIPPRLIKPTASRQYEPWKEQLISYWLLKWERSETFWKVGYPTNLLELALLANNPDEKDLKAQYLTQPITTSKIVDFVKAYKARLSA